jgi:1,4-alpha-glucan branching enzyme
MEEENETATKAGKQCAVSVTFVCDLKPGAKEVYLVGDFNGWDPRADRMQKRSGRFQKKMRLEPGEYQYKFVIDDEWHADPAAEMQVSNKHGTTNSVVKV